MKRYKLLKDLPFAKAGEELYLKFSEDSEFFLVYKGTDKAYTAELNPEFIDNFDEWFEEIKEAEKPKKYFYIGSMGHIESDEPRGWELSLSLRKMIGNHFETEEETERHIDYLMAKEVIKQDTKGFKPDWNDEEEKEYYKNSRIESMWDGYTPEIDEEVLVWTPRSDGVYTDIWIDFDDGIGFENTESEVIYWMSLPEPPKIEEK